MSFQFRKLGVFKLADLKGLDRDDLELELIDAGLEELDAEVAEDGAELTVARCELADFGTMQAALDARGLEPVSTGTEWVPATTTPLPDEHADEVLELVARIEADEDVQHVFHNLA